MRTRSITTLIVFGAALALLPADTSQSTSLCDSGPPFATSRVHPNVLLDVSIETPMQGAAYNDQNDTASGGSCTGRVTSGGKTCGACYFPDQEYIGIFDPDKCYSYNASLTVTSTTDFPATNGGFVPAIDANADHSCSPSGTYWSGNFLNWATMTAIDEFRWVLTGGNRVYDKTFAQDNTTQTVVRRANQTLGIDHSWFPRKVIGTGVASDPLAGTSTPSGHNVASNTVTPFSDTRVYISHNSPSATSTDNYKLYAGTGTGSASYYDRSGAGGYNVQVRVCDPTKTLEDNCVAYGNGSYYKPQGLIQNNATRMRFAIMSYLKNSSHDRGGGVLRANMKYAGPYLPNGTANSNAEFGTDGILVTNPNSTDATASSVNNSGVINYLNKFGSSGYKSYDPVSELFYECVRYYKHIGPTTDYSASLTADEKDKFPVITAWEDPIQHWCQKNYIVGVNDANPWNDKKLPGTFFETGSFNGVNLDDSDSGHDYKNHNLYGSPQNFDPDINVRELTNTVGDADHEGLNGTIQCFGCRTGTPTTTYCDMQPKKKVITGLGEIMGSCPYPSKENSYYVAGLAYYANTHDLRSDLPDKQTVTTFMTDTQEYVGVYDPAEYNGIMDSNTYGSNPLVGRMNMLWLTGKWGGFDDKFNDGLIHEQSQWDSDNDGLPDNYVLASSPEKLVSGLTKFFGAIQGSAGTAGSVATLTQQVQGEDIVVRGGFTIIDEASLAFDYIWQGHLESYWPWEGCPSLGETKCKETAGCTWHDTPPSCTGKLYDFQLDANLGKFCSQITGGHCWEAETYMPAALSRNIFTMTSLGGGQTSFNGTNMCGTGKPDYLGLTGDSYFPITDPTNCTNLVDWIKGVAWTNARDRKGWILGDIIYSTPVVVQQPVVATLPYRALNDPNFGSCDYSTGEECAAGCIDDPDLSELCSQKCFQCFRDNLAHRKKMVYVGANDGMLHAFVAAKWHTCTVDPITGQCPSDCSWVRGECGKWVYTPTDDAEIGTERWAYIPSNLLTELKELAKSSYGARVGGCAHRTMVDLSPQAYDVYIDSPAVTGTERTWRTVLIGGERGGGDVYFAIDVTDPDNPKVLWEFPAMRNLVTITQGITDQTADLPYAPEAVYNEVKNLPLSWSLPYVGNLKIPAAVSFLAADRIDPWVTGTPAINLALRDKDDLSGVVAVIGGGARLFDLADLPAGLTSDQKNSTLNPYLFMIDVEKGINLFQYLWPLMQGLATDPWPDVTSGSNSIPYAMSHPLVLDIWTSANKIGSDGYLDHIYIGDLNGNFYGLKFNLDCDDPDADPSKLVPACSLNTPGLKMDVWKTKPISEATVTNTFRSTRQPITVLPSAAFDPSYYLHVYFGAGKFDDIAGSADDKTDEAKMSFYSIKEASKKRPVLGTATSMLYSSPVGNSVTFSTKPTPRPFMLGGFGIDIDFHGCSSFGADPCAWTREFGVDPDKKKGPDCCETTCSTASCWTCVDDLNFVGERVVDSALVAGGLVFFTTFDPSPDPCLSGGEAYLYVLDYQCLGFSEGFDPLSVSGFTLRTSVSDVQANGGYVVLKKTIAGKDVGVAAVAKLGTGMPSQPVLDSANQCVYVQTSDAKVHKVKVKLSTPPLQLKGWKEEAN